MTTLTCPSNPPVQHAPELFGGICQPEHLTGKHRLCNKTSKAGKLLAIAGALDGILQQGRDFSRCDCWLDLLDGLQYEESIFSSRALKGRVTCAVFSALVFRCPEHPDFELWKERCHHVLEEGNIPYYRILAGVALSHYYYQRGDFAQGILIVDALFGITRLSTTPPQGVIAHRFSDAAFSYLRGGFERSLESVSDGLARLDGGEADPRQLAFFGMGAASALSLGDMEKAKAFLSTMARFREKMRPIDRVNYYSLVAYEALLRGDIFKAALFRSQLQRSGPQKLDRVLSVICQV